MAEDSDELMYAVVAVGMVVGAVVGYLWGRSGTLLIVCCFTAPVCSVIGGFVSGIIYVAVRGNKR